MELLVGFFALKSFASPTEYENHKEIVRFLPTAGWFGKVVECCQEPSVVVV
jgi:hypothetical protein